MAEYAYSLVQYVPDPAREERMNVGVVVASPAGDFLAGKLATQRHLGRLRRLGLALETEPLARLGESLSVSARTPDQLVVNAGAPWTYEALRARARSGAGRCSSARRAPWFTSSRTRCFTTSTRGLWQIQHRVASGHETAAG